MGIAIKREDSELTLKPNSFQQNALEI